MGSHLIKVYSSGMCSDSGIRMKTIAEYATKPKPLSSFINSQEILPTVELEIYNIMKSFYKAKNESDRRYFLKGTMGRSMVVPPILLF